MRPEHESFDKLTLFALALMVDIDRGHGHTMARYNLL